MSNMQEETAVATPTKTRSITDIHEEAATIGIRFREMSKCKPKDPYAVARLVALWRDSGEAIHVFCSATKSVSCSTLRLWAHGQTTQAKDWPALQAALAKQDGAALAAGLNAKFYPTHEPTPPLAPTVSSKIGDTRILAVDDKTGAITIERVVTERVTLRPGTPDYIAVVVSIWNEAERAKSPPR